MGQSLRHLYLCELLHRLLRVVAGAEHTVGADQFVYWDARDPRRCVAPDAFVRLSRPPSLFDSFKTWEWGAPELCVEVLSPSDTREPLTLEQKLERYDALGTRELLVFDADAQPGARLRAWDRVGDDWMERIVEGDTTPCVTLGLHWVVAGGPELAEMLRLAHDAQGAELVLLPEEAPKLEVERLRAELAQRI